MSGILLQKYNYALGNYTFYIRLKVYSVSVETRLADDILIKYSIGFKFFPWFS